VHQHIAHKYTVNYKANFILMWKTVRLSEISSQQQGLPVVFGYDEVSANPTNLRYP